MSRLLQRSLSYSNTLVSCQCKTPTTFCNKNSNKDDNDNSNRAHISLLRKGLGILSILFLQQVLALKNMTMYKKEKKIQHPRQRECLQLKKRKTNTWYIKIEEIAEERVSSGEIKTSLKSLKYSCYI